MWDLHGCCDSNFAGLGEELRRRSTTGYIFTLTGGVISAASTLQKLTAQSSTHAEKIAMATAAREALRLQGVVSELGFPCAKTHIFSDSTGALFAAGNNAFRGTSKFISTCYWLVRECVEKGLLTLHYCRTEDQPSDALTEHLPKAQFLKLRNMVQHDGLHRTQANI